MSLPGTQASEAEQPSPDFALMRPMARWFVTGGVLFVAATRLNLWLLICLALHWLSAAFVHSLDPTEPMARYAFWSDELILALSWGALLWILIAVLWVIQAVLLMIDGGD